MDEERGRMPWGRCWLCFFGALIGSCLEPVNEINAKAEWDGVDGDTDLVFTTDILIESFHAFHVYPGYLWPKNTPLEILEHPDPSIFITL